MRTLTTAVQQRFRRRLDGLGAVAVTVAEEPGPCPVCDGPMGVQKTVRRAGRTLEHGAFVAVETVHACRVGCRLPSGAPVVRRAASLAKRLPPGATIGYDVIVFVGLQRYVEHRQREEIRQALHDQYRITLSSGEVSTLATRFLVHLEALHAARTDELRAALAADGGWPLHIDATGENGRGTLLIAYTGWRGWVLGAWKISTERAEAVLPRLRSVTAHFGPPCAVLRDLGRAMAEASTKLVAELAVPIPILACHLHFARDVGKDLLAESHDQLRALFRHAEVLPRLRVLARDLGRRLGPRIDDARAGFCRWQEDDEGRHRLPEGDDGLGTVRGLVQWVLDFASDGADEGFPFDLPYLDLYRRCRTAGRAADAFQRTPPDGKNVRKALVRLRQAVRYVETEVPFKQTARRLEARARVFTELRDALRLGVKSDSRAEGRPRRALARDELARLQDVQSAIAQLATSLRVRRPRRGPAQDSRAAIDLVLAHLDRHGPYLFGHAIHLPGGRVRLVDRTNNELEGFNHMLKHGERRRSGRKVLTQDFEQLAAAAALARNLMHPDYVEILCGSLDRLPAAFAQLDVGGRRPAVPRPVETENAGEQDEVEAASLPTLDRRLVRTEEMARRIHAAAASRPPRLAYPTAL